MRHKRRWLAALLFQTGTLRAVKELLRDRLVVLNYHRVRPDDPDFTAPFDETVYGPTESQFDAQIAWLKRHVLVLSEAEVIECIRSGRGPGELAVVVTTDDGYRDNYTRVLPILDAHRVPAIFFIPSGMIDARRLGWWDQLAYLVKRTHKGTLTYEGTTVDLVDGRREALDVLRRRLIERMPDGCDAALAELARICEVEPPNAADQAAELMTWEQIREVGARGVAIGSHAHSHTILSRLDAERQRDELTLSRALIAERTGINVRSIAYPTGGRDHFTAATQRIAKDVGYEAGFSFYSGYNRWPTLSPFDIRRATVNFHDRTGIAAAAILPELLGWYF